MKLIILFIVLIGAGLFIYNSHAQNSTKITPQDVRIEISNDVEWSELEKIITNHHMDMELGKDVILSFIERNYPKFDTDFAKKIDMKSVQSQFVEYVTEVIQIQPIGNQIKSLNFGLFESSSNTFLLYISGSNRIPQESTDWAVNPEYHPEAYLEIEEYKIIYDELKKYKGNIVDIEQLLINGITNLAIANSLNEIDQLTNSRELVIGSGYDSGDIFLVRD